MTPVFFGVVTFFCQKKFIRADINHNVSTQQKLNRQRITTRSTDHVRDPV